MIDLTPLDVRNKRGDFRRGLRGYEPQEVDAFLETVADRMDILVRENMALRERTEELKLRVERQDSRENAVQEALVSAQSLREEIRAQAQRESELRLREADQEAERRRVESEHQAERVREEIERTLADGRRGLEELHRSRVRFLRAYRSLLEREMDVVQMEEERRSADDLDLDLDDLRIFQGGGQAVQSGQSGKVDAADHGSQSVEGGPVDQDEATRTEELPETSEPGEGTTAAQTPADLEALVDPYDETGSGSEPVPIESADGEGSSRPDAALAIDISPEREGRLPGPADYREASPPSEPFGRG